MQTSMALQPKFTGELSLGSDKHLPEVPRLHLDAVDVQIRNVDVPRLRRQTARIDAGAAVMEFVAASVRKRKAAVALSDGGQIGGHIGQLVGHEVDNFAF